jgi:hypothetical protein
VLTKKYSERVIFTLAEGPEELQELSNDLPRFIGRDLEASLETEGVVLRYDAPTRRAYCITRKGSIVEAWLWCDLGLQAGAKLLTAIVAVDEPMSENLALNLYESVVGKH